MTQEPLAFHNNLTLKQEVINRMKAHIEADELIQGTGYDSHTNQGCAITTIPGITTSYNSKPCDGNSNTPKT